MPANFPTLSGGSVAKHPLTRRRRQRFTVLTFADMSEQRFAMGTPLDALALTYTKVSTVDKDLVRQFWNDRRGSDDTDFDITLDDPHGTPTTYTHMQFTPGQTFEATEEATGLWSFTLSMRRTRGN